MAGFGWTFTPVPKTPSTSSQIACRICNRVFINTKALINHVEIHLEADDPVSSRQPDDPNRISSENSLCNRNPSLSAFSAPPNSSSINQNTHNLPSLQEIRSNPMLVGRSNMVSPRPSIPPQPPLSSSDMRNDNHPLGDLQISGASSQSNAKEDDPSIDATTKPLIQLLEKPFFHETELVDVEICNKNLLDLTLKL